jgi:low density lipoprotein receptor-related protein 5/6
MRRFDRLPPFTRKAAQPLYKTGLEIGNFEMKNMLAFQKLIVFTLVVVLLTFVVQGMGYAQGRGKIYWTESGKIRRANLNGSAVEDIITELEQPRDITLDLRNRKMYWIKSHPSKIRCANLDGSNIENIVTGFEFISCIAVDAKRSKIYFANRHLNQIQRANLDGSDIEDLVPLNRIAPMNIELDMDAGKMYWTDIWDEKITHANLDGSNIEDLVIDMFEPNGLALDVHARQMYWVVFTF